MSKNKGNKRSLSCSRFTPLKKIKSGDQSELCNDFNLDKLDELKGEITTHLTSGKASDREMGTLLLASVIHCNIDLINSKLRSDQASNARGELESFEHALSDILTILIPLINDESEKVRASAAQALSRISFLESDQVLDMILNCNIMSSTITWFNSEHDLEASNAYLTTTYCSLCDVLTNLCSTNDKAFKSFNDSNLSEIMAKSITHFKKNIDIATASCICLSLVTEDNDEFKFKDILLPICESLLNEFSYMKDDHHHLFLINLASLIIFNLKRSNSHRFNIMLDVIETTLNIKLESSMTELYKNISQLLEDCGFREKTAASDYKFVDDLLSLISAKKVSVEMITNLILSDDDFENNDEMECETIESEDENSSCGISEKIGSNIDPEIEALMTERNIFYKLCNQIFLPDQNLHSHLKKVDFGRKVLDAIEDFLKTSLIGICNFTEILSGPVSEANCEQFLHKITSLVFFNDNALAAEASNALRAILSRVNPNIEFSESDVEKLLNLYNNSDSFLAKVNVIKILACLAMQAKTPTAVEAFSSSLLEMYSKQNDLQLKAEILDSMMDIFAEDDKNVGVFIKLNLNEKLKELGFSFRKQAAKFRHKDVIDTVYRNIIRFVNYKEKLYKNC